MQSVFLNFRFFSLFFVIGIFLLPLYLKGEQLKVSGQIYSTSKKNPVGSIPIILIAYNPEKEDQKINSVGVSKTDQDGTFEFKPFQAILGIKYLIGMVYQNKRYPSYFLEYNGQESMFFEINMDNYLKDAESTISELEQPTTQEVRFQGKLKGDSVIPYSEIPVMLLQISSKIKKDKSPMIPLVRGKVDSEGNFEFPPIQAEVGESYLVGVLYQEKRFSSGVITLKKDQPPFFEIDLPQEVEPIGEIADEIIVSGKLTTLGDTSLENIPLMLLKFDKQKIDSPPMVPVIRSVSKKEGEFEFPPIQPEEGVSYLVGALIFDQRISSAQKIYRGGKTMNFEIRIPKFSDNFSKLHIIKSFLVFTPLVEGVRVTDITQMINLSDATLYSKEKSPKKRLPAGAKNLQYFKENKQTETSVFEDGFYYLRDNIPPGESTFYIEYDLDRDFSGIYFENLFFKGTKSVEILTQKDGINVQISNFFLPVEEKEIEGKFYYSFYSELDGETKHLDIHLDNLPIPNRYFIIIASIITLIILTILIFSVVQTRKRQTSTNSS